MLKVACGLYFAKTVAHRADRPPVEHDLKMNHIIDAFGGRWQPGCGLYIQVKDGATHVSTIPLQLSPIATTIDHRIIGSSLKLFGVDYTIVFDPIDLDPDQLLKEGYIYRPSELLFQLKLRRHLVELSWPSGTPPKTISFKSLPGKTLLQRRPTS